MELRFTLGYCVDDVPLDAVGGFDQGEIPHHGNGSSQRVDEGRAVLAGLQMTLQGGHNTTLKLFLDVIRAHLPNLVETPRTHGQLPEQSESRRAVTHDPWYGGDHPKSKGEERAVPEK